MKPTTGDGFSGAAYPTPPTVQQPASPTIPQRIMFNRSYLFSLTGVMRIALMVSVSFILLQIKGTSIIKKSVFDEKNFHF